MPLATEVEAVRSTPLDQIEVQTPSTTRPRPLVLALLIPLQGPAGIFGPSCELCAELAVEEINAGGGVLGRELQLRVVDAGAAPQRVAHEVDRLLCAGLVDAVVGWHASTVRQAVAPRIAQRVPYIYTALYEGGEMTPGVFMTGETPERQVLAALRWMVQEVGLRRWTIVGNDYVWPRRTAAAVRRSASACGIEIRDEIFVGLGSTDFGPTLRRLDQNDYDGVLMLMLGADGVEFNRQFSAAGLEDRCVRLSPLMDENMLLATGASKTRGIYSTAGFFETLPTAQSLDFGGRYARRFGHQAPVISSMGESCYEGVRLLAEIARVAGSLDVPRLCAMASGTSYGSPRGEVRLMGRHLQQQVYLAQAIGLDLDVLATL